MVKILRNLKEITRVNFQNLVFSLAKNRYFVVIAFKMFKDGIQIQVYNITNKSVSHFSQFISVKVKKNLRKFQAQFREKLRKLRLRQKAGFLIKKMTCNYREDLHCKNVSFRYICFDQGLQHSS